MKQPISGERWDKLPDSALVDVTTVANQFGVSVPTVWRWCRNGFLPKPKAIGPNSTRWVVGELRKLMAGFATRNQAQQKQKRAQTKAVESIAAQRLAKGLPTDAGGSREGMPDEGDLYSIAFIARACDSYYDLAKALCSIRDDAIDISKARRIAAEALEKLRPI